MKKLSFFLISLGLAVVLSFTASWQLLYNLKLQHDVNKLEVSTNYDLANFSFNPDAFSIYQGTDYNAALSLTQNMVFQQDENYLTVDTMTMLYISPQAIADFMANNQDETFLGVSTDQLMYIESMWNDTVVYYIDGSGQPQLAQIPPDPNIFRVIMSVAQIAVGGILLAVPGAQAAGAFMIAGGVSGLISEFFMEEIGQIFDAASTIMTGINCVMVGISLLSCNPFGVALGVTSILVGGATTLVGLNDLGTVITGVNLIQAITGMSDSAYSWMKMGLTIASTVLTIVGSIYKVQWDNAQKLLGNNEKVPNPYGKNGGPAHQETIAKTKADLEAQGYTTAREQYVKTPDGLKSGRYIDLAVVDGQGNILQGYQIGKSLSDGITPIAREAKALDDLRKVLGDIFKFVPYN